MRAGPRSWFWAAIMLLVCCATSSSPGAITASNVLVLYNQDDSASCEIAAYYAAQHPGVELLGLSGVTTTEEVTADYYLDTIRPKILDSNKLTDAISTIVTTKGLPLRINVTEQNPGTYTDPFGVTRPVRTGRWKAYSSLESELTRIDEISTWQQMGDQTYYVNPSPTTPQPSSNPYYGVSTGFNYSDYLKSGYGNKGMRLTARLDGFCTADVKASIDRAQKAFVIPGTSQYIVMDDDPNPTGSDLIDELKTILDERAYPYVYDATDAAITTASRPILGYVSHGTNDGALGLDTGYVAGLGFDLANGAVFHTHESFNGYSFVSGGNYGGQALVAEWLAKGGTVGIGNVQEPTSGPTYEANENQMFKMLLNGNTWAEAAWSSIRQLSYVNTVVGDPLMTWKTLTYGDANMDGCVDIKDLTLLGMYWQEYDPAQAGGYWWGHGDFSGDGRINIDDLTLMGMYWGTVASWADGEGSSVAFDPALFLATVPEPSSKAIALSGLAAVLIGFGWQRLHA